MENIFITNLVNQCAFYDQVNANLEILSTVSFLKTKNKSILLNMSINCKSIVTFTVQSLILTTHGSSLNLRG